MGDSDDEYDRKRRDKFRGERTESYRGGEGRRDERRNTGGGMNRGDDWAERESWSNSVRSSGRVASNYGEYRSGRSGNSGYRERNSSPVREMAPPIKRSRTDWGEERRYTSESNYSSGYTNNPWGPDSYFSHSGGSHGNANSRESDSNQTQPAMMSFKAFLQTQDDNISDEEAILKYNEYKLEFKRQQLNDFFVNHKDEEWFKIKYHPEDAVKRKDEQMNALQNRIKVFMELLDKKTFSNVTVDADQSEALVKLLDCVVIKLEGGTEFDLEILEETISAFIEQEKVVPPTSNVATPIDDSNENKEEEPINEDKKEEEGETNEDTAEEKNVPESEENKENEESKRSGEYSSSSSVDENVEDKDGEIVATPSSPSKENGNQDNRENEDDSKSEEINEDKNEEIDDKKDYDDEDDEKPKPRALHKTASIFLRNLAPTITKQEVESMCKRYPGFLRVAIADPQPERRWFRRGWVTFERNVNIKEICWNLNNIRLRDCELGAIVNRDLSRRVRTVNGITSHKQVVRNDIKVAARIVQNLDEKNGLWLDDKQKSDIPSFGLVSKNPVLKNITDYLIEEASAEEEELLGQASGDADTEAGEIDPNNSSTVERDDTLLRVLDKLLFYLRIVHSVDYYNHCEYPNEDEMPNRCGIMHARGIPPSSKVTQQEITDYCHTFEQKIASFLQAVVKLSEEDLQKLGAKDPDAEVEKFVVANTQELSKDKWLCPLSGKKFKGPDFVRKHIFNKHTEKIDEVKKEVEYFNNYLRDPKRPQLPEHPGNRGSKREAMDSYQSSNYSSQYGGGYNNFGGGNSGRYSNFNYSGPGYNREPYREFSRPRGGQFNNRGRGGDSRPLMHYRDLDAPSEQDEF